MYQIVLQGKFCKNMTRAREIWNDIMSAGRNHQAALWLDYLKIERYGIKGYMNGMHAHIIVK